MNKLWLLLIVLIIACKHQHEIQKTVVAPIVADTVITYPFVIDSMYSNRFQFDWLQMKAKISITDSSGAKNSFSATIRIKHDSIIWASLGISGIEGARVLINHDSVFVMNHLNGENISQSFSWLQNFTALPITFTDLESILVGSPVFVDSTDNLVSKTDSTWNISTGSSTIKNTIQLNSGYRLLTMFLTDVLNQRSMEATFAQYDTTVVQPFSMQRSITIRNPKTSNIDISFSKLKINEPLEFPFNLHE